MNAEQITKRIYEWEPFSVIDQGGDAYTSCVWALEYISDTALPDHPRSLYTDMMEYMRVNLTREEVLVLVTAYLLTDG